MTDPRSQGAPSPYYTSKTLASFAVQLMNDTCLSGAKLSHSPVLYTLQRKFRLCVLPRYAKHLFLLVIEIEDCEGLA